MLNNQAPPARAGLFLIIIVRGVIVIRVKLLFVLHFYLIAILGISAAGCTADRKKSEPSADWNVITRHVFATIAADELPSTSDPGAEHLNDSAAVRPPDIFYIEMNSQGTGAAYIAKVGSRVRVVHNGSPGRDYNEIENGKLAISNDGKRIAYPVKKGEFWYMVVDGFESGPYSAIGPPVFSPDSKHIAFEIKKTDRWQILVDHRWFSPPAISYFEKPVFNADSSRLLFVENEEGARKKRTGISDLAFKSVHYVEACGTQLAVNMSKTRVATVSELNRHRLIQFDFAAPERIREGKEYDSIDGLSFSADGQSVVHLAKSGGARFVVVNGKEAILPDGGIVAPPIGRPDGKSASVIMSSGKGVYLYPVFADAPEPKSFFPAISNVVYSTDNKRCAFISNKSVVINGILGEVYDKVADPMFSPDGSFVVYRAMKGEARFVVVADGVSGRFIRQLASHERVFPVVFSADGKIIGYGVKDGKTIAWETERL